MVMTWCFLPWAWVQSLVGELRFHKPRIMAKNQNKNKRRKKNLVIGEQLAESATFSYSEPQFHLCEM